MVCTGKGVRRERAIRAGEGSALVGCGAREPEGSEEMGLPGAGVQPVMKLSNTWCGLDAARMDPRHVVFSSLDYTPVHTLDLIAGVSSQSLHMMSMT